MRGTDCGDMSTELPSLGEFERRSAGELLAMLYGELRVLAERRIAREAANYTLQPTELVHEAWLRVGGEGARDFESRGHFFAVAAEAMRRILIDRARKKLAGKRGNGVTVVPLDEELIPGPQWNDDELLLVNEALERFAAVDARKAELVKLRYFAGFNFEQAAEAMGIAVPTAKQWWAYARAWLSVELKTLRAEKK